MATLARINRRRDAKRNGHSVKCADKQDKAYRGYDIYVCTCSVMKGK